MRKRERKKVSQTDRNSESERKERIVGESDKKKEKGDNRGRE